MAYAKHNKVATFTDNPEREINKGEWNDNHPITLEADENFVTNAEKSALHSGSNDPTSDQKAAMTAAASPSAANAFATMNDLGVPGDSTRTVFEVKEMNVTAIKKGQVCVERICCQAFKTAKRWRMGRNRHNRSINGDNWII